MVGPHPEVSQPVPGVLLCSSSWHVSCRGALPARGLGSVTEVKPGAHQRGRFHSSHSCLLPPKTLNICLFEVIGSEEISLLETTIERNAACDPGLSRQGREVLYVQVQQRGFPGGSDYKESTCNAGDLGSIPELGRSPGEGILLYSNLEKSLDGGAWQAIQSTGSQTVGHS